MSQPWCSYTLKGHSRTATKPQTMLLGFTVSHFFLVHRMRRATIFFLQTRACAVFLDVATESLAAVFDRQAFWLISAGRAACFYAG